MVCKPKRCLYSTTSHSPSPRMIRASYVRPDGVVIDIKAAEGTNMLEAAHDNNIDLEGNSPLKLS